MNIFEFLGLPANYRPANKVTQLVKHLDEVPESKLSFTMYGEVKKDGCYAFMVCIGSKVGFFSRKGKRFTNCEHLEDRYSYSPEGVYVAEICNDKVALAVHSGWINPNRVNALSDEDMKTHQDYCSLHFRDFIPIDDFITGHCEFTYSRRRSLLCSKLLVRASDFILIPCPIFSMEELHIFAKEEIEHGHEGVVFHQDTDWIAGHKGFREIKVIKGVSYDLECVGMEEGKGKYAGKVANLLFRFKKGMVIKAMLGKGYTHEDAEEMFRNFNDYLGEIFDVYALEESSKGKLRNPKIGEHRFDKTEPDF